MTRRNYCEWPGATTVNDQVQLLWMTNRNYCERAPSATPNDQLANNTDSDHGAINCHGCISLRIASARERPTDTATSEVLRHPTLWEDNICSVLFATCPNVKCLSRCVEGAKKKKSHDPYDAFTQPYPYYAHVDEPFLPQGLLTTTTSITTTSTPTPTTTTTTYETRWGYPCYNYLVIFIHGWITPGPDRLSLGHSPTWQMTCLVHLPTPWHAVELQENFDHALHKADFTSSTKHRTLFLLDGLSRTGIPEEFRPCN